MVVSVYNDMITYMATDVTDIFYSKDLPTFPTAYVNVKDTYYVCDVTDKQVVTPDVTPDDTFNSLGFAWAGQSCEDVPQTLPTLNLTTLPQPIHLVGNYEFTADQTLTMDTLTQVQHIDPGCLTANGVSVHVTVLEDSPTSGTIDLVTGNCFAGTGFGTATVDILNLGVCDAVVNALADRVTLTLTACAPPPNTPGTPGTPGTPPGTQPETPLPAPGAQPPGVPPPSDKPGSPNAANQLVAAFLFLGLLCFL